MSKAYFPSLKKTNNDQKNRFFEILKQIKDYISKKKYNLAFQTSIKYYEQNRQSLKNEEIFEFCWYGFKSISKKIHNRILNHNIRSNTQISNSHIRHLLSMFCMAHNIVLPEFVNLNKNYFHMLNVRGEIVDNSVFLNEHEIPFQRNQGFFLKSKQTRKTIKRIVREHLKNCNLTIMFIAAQKKSSLKMTDQLKRFQEIFSKFKEIDFPVEKLQFQLIKLSILEDFGLNEGIKCNFTLPLGFMNKIYRLIKSNNEDKRNYYLEKLYKYLILCIRNRQISIQNMYIICAEILYIDRILQKFKQIKKQNIKANYITGNFLRKITIQSAVSDSRQEFSKQQSGFAFSRQSQQSLKTKQKYNRPIKFLVALSYNVLKKISFYLDNRKQLEKVIKCYFYQGYIEKKRDNTNDQYIIYQNQIEHRHPFENTSKSKKQNVIISSMQPKQRSNSSLLETIIKKKQQRKNISQKKINKPQLNIHANKILLNIKSVSKNTKLSLNKVQIKAKNKGSHEQQIKIPNTSLVVSDCEQQQHIDPVQKAKNTITEQINRINRTSNEDRQRMLNKSTQNKQHEKIQINQQYVNEKEQIMLLDTVIQKQIQAGFEIPNNVSAFTAELYKKLNGLRWEIKNLNQQRKMVVERLSYQSHHHQNIEDLQQTVENSKHRSTSVESFRLKQNIKVFFNTESKLQSIKSKKKPLQIKRAQNKQHELNLQVVQKQLKHSQNKNLPRISQNSCTMSIEYDKLRRNVSKTQFAALTNKKQSKKSGAVQPTKQKASEAQKVEVE